VEVHSCEGASGGPAPVQQLQRADDPLAVGGGDLTCGPRVAGAEQLVQGRRPVLVQLGDPPLAHARGGRRAQRQLGERGPQIQPGAADDDRSPAGGEQAVDLGVGQLGVATDAERLIDGHEGEQPVLQHRLLVGCGRAGEQLQAGVHLQRVGRDRDRRLAARAQPLAQRHRDLGLAHAGGSEQRDHLGAGHRPSIRRGGRPVGGRVHQDPWPRRLVP
jgi:hypothetical protein